MSIDIIFKLDSSERKKLIIRELVARLQEQVPINPPMYVGVTIRNRGSILRETVCTYRSNVAKFIASSIVYHLTEASLSAQNYRYIIDLSYRNDIFASLQLGVEYTKHTDNIVTGYITVNPLTGPIIN